MEGNPCRVGSLWIKTELDSAHSTAVLLLSPHSVPPTLLNWTPLVMAFMMPLRPPATFLIYSRNSMPLQRWLCPAAATTPAPTLPVSPSFSLYFSCCSFALPFTVAQFNKPTIRSVSQLSLRLSLCHRVDGHFLLPRNRFECS